MSFEQFAGERASQHVSALEATRTWTARTIRETFRRQICQGDIGSVKYLCL